MIDASQDSPQTRHEAMAVLARLFLWLTGHDEERRAFALALLVSRSDSATKERARLCNLCGLSQQAVMARAIRSLSPDGRQRMADAVKQLIDGTKRRQGKG